MTDEEIDRFALVLKECERIRAMKAREEAALPDGEHDGIPMAAAPPEQRPPVLTRPPPPNLLARPLGAASTLDKCYSPECVEGAFSEVRCSSVQSCPAMSCGTLSRLD